LSQVNNNSSSGSSGTGILTINDIGADDSNNFTLSSLGGISFTGVTNGLELKNTEPVSEFVVDSQGNAGYTTIQAAITAAALVASSTTPQTVWVWPGNYTENLTLASYVNVASACLQSVVITGNATYSGAAGERLSCIGLVFTTPATGNAFTYEGTAASTITFIMCAFNATNGSGTAVAATNPNSTLNQYNCLLTISSGNQTFNTACSITVIEAFIQSSGTPSSFTGPRALFLNSFIADNFSSTTTMVIISCYFMQGNLTGTNATFLCFNTAFDTTETYWVTGTGAITYGSITTNALLNTALTASTLRLKTGPISFDGGTTSISTSSGSLVSSPPASATATTTFGTSLTAATAKQNTNGYDVLLNICVTVTSATAATLTLGIGPTSTPTVDTVVSSFTVATSTVFTFSAYVPSTYYVLVSSTGTPTISGINCQVCTI